MTKSRLVFIEPIHTYMLDGKILPSATQIIQEILPNKYDGISEEVLHKKAEFGTKGHSIIEHLDISDLDKAKEEVNEIDNIKLQICIEEYLRLVGKYKIEKPKHELMVHYKDIYAGTLDMIAKVNEINSLIDIKFTSKLDKEYLSWQLGLYELAYGKKFKKHYCLFLPKGELGQLVEIEIKTEKEIIDKLIELGYMEVKND